MDIEYNKLVRDRIPEIIAADGKQAETVTLGEAAFGAALRTKLIEEAQEAASAPNREALLAELADVLEVVYALVATQGATIEDMEAVRRDRAESRGGFDRRLRLTRTRDLEHPVPAGSSAGCRESGGAADVAMMVYELLSQLPRHDWQTPRSELPESGIYVFYERGEVLDADGRTYDRIVRVGTHNQDGNFRSRIGQHYGPRATAGGDRSGSVFRKHLGGALLRRSNLGDPRLQNWHEEVGKFPEVEAEVSRVLRDDFTFVCFPVKNKHERLALERGLIGLLAQHPLGVPSAGWLGRYARNEKIRESGLWNVKDVDAEPLTLKQLQQIKVLAERP